MELIAYYIYGTFCLVGGLALGYYWRSWEERKSAQLRVAQVEQRVSEPEPVKRTNYSAVHCLDQVDALLERLETTHHE